MAHHGMQNIFDINSQNSLLPTLPISRSEPDLDLQQGFVSMPQNPNIHHGMQNIFDINSQNSLLPALPISRSESDLDLQQGFLSMPQNPNIHHGMKNIFDINSQNSFLPALPISRSEPDLDLQQGFVSMPQNPNIHHGMQNIFDINSQNSLLPALPISRSEPDLDLQQGFVSMPQNPNIHHGMQNIFDINSQNSLLPALPISRSEPDLDLQQGFVSVPQNPNIHHGMQNIFDINSQNSLLPALPISRSESDLDLQQGFVSMPQNPNIHHGMQNIFDINSQNSLLPALPISRSEPDWDLQQGSVSMPQNPNIHHGMQNIFDINSQNSFLPALPISRSEPDLDLQQGFVSMPQNPNTHQYGYGPMLLEQASSSASPSYSNHVQEPSPVAMTENFFGFTTPMSPTLHDVEDWINEFNQEPNACDIQGPRDILHQTTTLSSNIQCSQDLEIERLLGHVKAYEMQKNLAAPASMNGVTQCDKGKNHESSSTSFPSLQEFSSTILGFSSPTTIEDGPSSHVLSSTNAKTALLTREQPSANVLKILNKNDRETFFISSRIKRGRTRKPLSEELIKQLEKFQPLPLGRPPKRREGGESSSNLGKFQKRCSGARTIGMTAKPKEGHKTPENVQNEDQSADLTNPSSALRQYLNSAYDPKYQKDGDFVDPHLRLFDAITGK